MQKEKYASYAEAVGDTYHKHEVVLSRKRSFEVRSRVKNPSLSLRSIIKTLEELPEETDHLFEKRFVIEVYSRFQDGHQNLLGYFRKEKMLIGLNARGFEIINFPGRIRFMQKKNTHAPELRRSLYDDYFYGEDDVYVVDQHGYNSFVTNWVKIHSCKLFCFQLLHILFI